MINIPLPLDLDWYGGMNPGEVLLVAMVLVATLGVGTVVHEFAHAVVLSALRVPYDITWLPDRDASGLLKAGIFGTWAAVTPASIPVDAPTWGLRMAALMPLTLALPFLLIPAGIVPDPLSLGNPYVIAAVTGWMACAIPSPRDFSWVWHASELVDDVAATA